MSVNPDDMNMSSGVAEEFVDLEHQVIRQKANLIADPVATLEVQAGDNGGDFDPGERQLDREEVAQLVYYRRFATINWLDIDGAVNVADSVFAIVDASVGINGDLFRAVTTQESFAVAGNPNSEFLVDTGGEIGLLDNYQIFSQPSYLPTGGSGAAGGVVTVSEFAVDYYDWPTGGPIVDSFDTINCGLSAGIETESASGAECQIELRYDFYWDVAEQGRSTNPFGRPSTR